MTSIVERVVIVGGGVVAWLSAAALKKAFRHRQLEVIVLDSGQPFDAPIGRWTLPSLRGIHALIGIKESDLLRDTGATFKLATEHRAWQSDSSSFLHAFGEIGAELKGTPFYQYLLMLAMVGEAHNLEAYSLAASAARRGRFARPMSNTSLTSSFTYAYHLEESVYCAYLRAHAEKLGVRRYQGCLLNVSLSQSGQVDALTLENGEHLQADYFLDCSGARAVLMSRIAETECDSWTDWLPNDRMLSARAPALDDPAAITQTTAARAGWLWQIPVRQASLVGYVYCSAFSSDEEALEELRSTIAGACGEPASIALSSGRRKRFWSGNCVALGDAAVQLEPLAGANLHLVQLGIATFIELFPLARDSPLEAIEYNRIMGEHADALRDFTIAHYRVGPAKPGDYWAATRAHSPPARYAQKLDLFRASGRINLLDNETFEEVDWAWLLLGSGCMPDTIELHVQANLAAAPVREFALLRESIERLVATMPRHIDFLRQHGGGDGRTADGGR